MSRVHGGHRQTSDHARTAASPLTTQPPGPLFRPRGSGHPQRDALVALAPLGGLIGRESDIDALVGRLADVHMLTLTGAPGVGKSRLALEVAGRIQAAGASDGAIVVSVEAISSPGELGATVARALGEPEGDSWADRGQVNGTPALVVLDDCDYLLRACAEVAHTLVGRGMAVLATARESLGVAGESTWRVPPLPVPPPEIDQRPKLFAGAEAVQLLCDRAAYVNRDFGATPDTAWAIAEICRRLDGVPLAIELAASVMTSCSPTDVAGHLDDPFPLLSSGPCTVHPRHQSLWACLAWSYDRLSVPEQMVLEALAVFPATFTAQSALEVCIPEGMAEPEFEVILRGLVDKSLIEVETLSEGARYRLLGMMRWFGLDKLAAGGEEQAQRHEHARWCTGLVASARDPRAGRPWLEQMEPFHDDIEVALAWALASGAAETAALLGEVDLRLCQAEGRYGEARGRAQEMAAAPASPGLHARAVTPRPGANRSQRPTAGLAALTASQRSVAELVAEGLSNGEIARKLGIRPTTVKAHLRSAFAKVGVENRTALAVVLHRSRR